MTRRTAWLYAALGTAALAIPGQALGAGSSNPIINDCLAHPGGLTGHYSVAQLTHALAVMPAETKEYTSCPDVLNRARLAALHGLNGGGSSSGGSSFLPTPVLIILIVVVLAAITFGAVAVRRRQAAGGSGPGGPGGSGVPPPGGPAA